MSTTAPSIPQKGSPVYQTAQPWKMLIRSKLSGTTTVAKNIFNTICPQASAQRFLVTKIAPPTLAIISAIVVSNFVGHRILLLDERHEEDHKKNGSWEELGARFHRGSPSVIFV